jgi:hypothetical protein
VRALGTSGFFKFPLFHLCGFGDRDNSLGANGIKMLSCELPGSKLGSIDICENPISGRIDMGLLSILATLPFLAGVIFIVVAIRLGHMSFWISAVVLTVGSSAVPSGKLASSFSSSSFDARAQLRAAGAKHRVEKGTKDHRGDLRLGVAVNFWLPLTFDEAAQVVSFTLVTFLMWPLMWVIRVSVYGAIAMVYQRFRGLVKAARKRRAKTSIAPDPQSDSVRFVEPRVPQPQAVGPSGDLVIKFDG